MEVSLDQLLTHTTKVLNEHGHMVNDAFLKRYLLRLSFSTPVVS